MFSLLDRAYLMAAGHCLFAGPPSAAEAWFAGAGLPCPVGTAVAEHMLDAVSTPGSLAQLLAAREAAGGGQPQLPPPHVGLGADQDGGGGGAKLDGGSSQQGSASEDGGGGGDKAGALAPLAAPRRSVSRELAVVFWRTLVDILRNPTLLLLHWCERPLEAPCVPFRAAPRHSRSFFQCPGCPDRAAALPLAPSFAAAAPRRSPLAGFWRC
jgi:hypothetical protein